MTNTSETKAVASKKSVDVFIDVANASLDLVYALVAAANKARRDRIREAAAATELRLTTLRHGPHPRLRDTDSVP